MTQVAPITLLAIQADGSTKVIGEARPGEVLAIPPITVQTVDSQGNVQQEVKVPAGGRLRLNHHPIP